MNPEERELLHRTFKLSEENNWRLKNIERHMFWGRVWGFIKVAIIVVPLVIGYLYLDRIDAGANLKQAQELFKAF